MAAELEIVIRKFEPPDPKVWARATSAQRKAWYKLVAKHASAILKKRLLAGRDRYGKKFLRRLNPTPDGSNGPPLSPHAETSRAVRLLKSRSDDKSATLYWESGFGEIMKHHQDGIPSRLGVRVRDVGGFTDKERTEFYNLALSEWKGPEEASSTKTVEVPQGETDTRFGSMFGKTKPQKSTAVRKVNPPPPKPQPLPIESIAPLSSPPPSPKPKTAAERLEEARLAQIERNKQLRAQGPATPAGPATSPATSPALAAAESELRKAEAEVARLRRLQAAAPANQKRTFDRSIGIQEDIAKDARRMADQERAKAKDIQALLAAAPERIPPGPLAKRMESYEYGKAKVQAILEITAETKEVKDRFDKAWKDIERLQIENRTAKGKVIAANNKQVNAWRAEIKDLGARLDKLKEEQARRIKEVLQIKDGPTVAVGYSSVGYKAETVNKEDRRFLRPLSEAPALADRAVESIEFLNGIARATPDSKDVHRSIGFESGVRANCSPTRISLDESDHHEVIIHEYGHALEHDLNLNARSEEFIELRTQGETLVSLKDKFGPAFRDDEFGRKDNWATLFGEQGAYYVGKKYSSQGSEVVSMALQKLYEDPAAFAEKDPEFLQFLLGLLDGSLR